MAPAAAVAAAELEGPAVAGSLSKPAVAGTDEAVTRWLAELTAAEAANSRRRRATVSKGDVVNRQPSGLGSSRQTLRPSSGSATWSGQLVTP